MNYDAELSQSLDGEITSDDANYFHRQRGQNIPRTPQAQTSYNAEQYSPGHALSMQSNAPQGSYRGSNQHKNNKSVFLDYLVEYNHSIYMIFERGNGEYIIIMEAMLPAKKSKNSFMKQKILKSVKYLLVENIRDIFQCIHIDNVVKRNGVTTYETDFGNLIFIDKPEKKFEYSLKNPNGTRFYPKWQNEQLIRLEI